MKINLNQAEFIKSAAKREDFPNNTFPQIIFAGKSNVGKSSVINRILNRKNFARVGASPGKTIHINYFLIDQKLYFVDLPGYGYAKVSMQEQTRWGNLIEEFFASDKPIDFGIFIVDIRHRPTKDDGVMAQCFKQLGIPFCIVANKYDKLKKSQIEPAISIIAQDLDVNPGIIIPFSAEKGVGKEELIARILMHLD